MQNSEPEVNQRRTILATLILTHTNGSRSLTQIKNLLDSKYDMKFQPQEYAEAAAMYLVGKCLSATFLAGTPLSLIDSFLGDPVKTCLENPDSILLKVQPEGQKLLEELGKMYELPTD